MKIKDKYSKAKMENIKCVANELRAILLFPKSESQKLNIESENKIKIQSKLRFFFFAIILKLFHTIFFILDFKYYYYKLVIIIILIIIIIKQKKNHIYAIIINFNQIVGVIIH